MLKSIRISEKWAKIIAGVMLCGAIVTPAVGILASSSSQPRDDNPNSIIWGGCYSREACVDAMQNGDGHGHSGANITKIYAHFGLTKSNLENSTVAVTVFKDGHVTINQEADGFKSGQTIATGAESVGRDNIPGSTFIASVDVYESDTQNSFLSNSITGFGMISGGKLQFFILNSCGNVGTGHPVSPPPSPKPTPKPTPSPSKSPKPMPSPSPMPTPMPSPSASPTPMTITTCVDLQATQPDASNPDIYQFTIQSQSNGSPNITGYLWTLSNANQPITTDANTPFIDETITSGSLTVQGQIETDQGTTAISFACTATVIIPTPTASPTPSGTPAVLGESTQPLPNTGAESTLGGALGLTGIGFATRAYWRSRKSLVDSLRHRKK